MLLALTRPAFFKLYSVVVVNLSSAYILSYERNDAVFSKNTAGDTIRILMTKLVLREICIDDGCLLAIQAGVDNVIENRSRKLVDDLGAQIVNNQ